ncbi:hypothetical protein T439DRAFT_324559 [Meredithblackwellia eburnea MCA 4105]
MWYPPRVAPSPFPVQFDNKSRSRSPSISSQKRLQQQQQQQQKWPDSDDEPDSDQLTPNSLRPVHWNLKTDSEQYIASLESKLNRLVTPASISKPDSGYGSSSARTILHSPRQYPGDLISSLPIQDDLSYGQGLGDPAIEEESREGDGLLWGTPGRESSSIPISSDEDPSSRVSPSRTDFPIDNDTAPITDEEQDRSYTPGSSPLSSGIVTQLIPPTPAKGENVASERAERDQEGERELDEEDEQGGEGEEGRAEEEEGPEALEFRAPSQLVGAHSRRISFNSSVRISGGMGKKNKHHRHHPSIQADTYVPPSSSPSNSDYRGKARVPSSSSLYSLPPNASGFARSSSPGGSHIRRGSSGSLHPHHHSGYSSAATSAVPSRSSSPCSSIYAPLQPPSQTCPSPMMVRPPPKRTKGMTFSEYLRGRAEDNDESTSRGYRELVEAQRRKKARWEARRSGSTAERDRNRERERLTPSIRGPQEAEGFWARIKQLVSSGMGGGAGGGPRGGGRAYSYYGGADILPPPPKRVRRSNKPPPPPSVSPSTRGGEFPGANGLEGSSEDGGSGFDEFSTRGRSRTHRTPRRKASTLSMSTSSDADDERPAGSEERENSSSIVSDDDVFYGSSSSPSTSPPSSRRPDPKTAEDVMFGPAPARWTRFDWWAWSVRKAVTTVFGPCFGYQRDREQDEEERGY